MFPPCSIIGIISLIFSAIYLLLLINVFKSKGLFLNIGISILFTGLFFCLGGHLYSLNIWLYDSLYFTVLNCSVIIISHLILVYTLVKFFKSKNKKWLIGLFASLFLFYLTLPWYLQAKAFESWKPKYIEYAVKLSTIPQQKGYLYLTSASLLGYNNMSYRLKCYEKAHKYLEYNAAVYGDGGRYKRKIWTFPLLDYYDTGNFDKAIEVGMAVENYYIVSNAYVMKNDYQNALKYIDLYIEQEKISKAWGYAYKANILRNLDKEQDALVYYHKALDHIEKNKNFKKNITEYYNNKNSVRESWEKRKTEYIKKGEVKYNNKTSCSK